jgi:hypothetical protein
MQGWKAPVEPFTPGSGPEAVKGLTVGVWLVGGRNGFGQGGARIAGGVVTEMKRS